uniref:LRRNT domain-containing protein n=1 Tax=Stomoxys calcitrans TaxID=35570 RepID=A0A1I8P948_STOCA
MHISYKFGLVLIFILCVSFCHTRAAPATNKTSTRLNDYSDDDYDDDYYDDNQAAEEPPSPDAPVTPLINLGNSLLNLLDIPTRSNHVVEPICPKACLCLEDYKYIDCSNGRLVEVPHDIPPTAMILDLSHNHIKHIKATDFSHRLKLQEINLSNNYIEEVTSAMFEDLPRLQRLRLASNRLTDIDPDTFRGASDLSLLDLNNNAIKLRRDKSFLNQPSLLELNCRNCSWTEIYEDTFKNTSRLTALRIDNNDFDKKINTRAFIPLKSLIKLRVPELNQNSTEELCNLLKFIDNISFKHFEVSCYELVLGASYNESIILVTDPPYKQPTGVELETTTYDTVANPATANTNEKAVLSKMSSNMTSLPEEHLANDTEIAKASAGFTETGPSKENVKGDEEEAYKVPISQEAINQMLIGLMIVSVIGIIIGILCRKDVWGIKTKCCRTKKPIEDKAIDSNGQAAEEIPLNKIA